VYGQDNCQMGQARVTELCLGCILLQSTPTQVGLDCCVVMRLPPHKASRDMAMIDRCGAATCSIHVYIYWHTHVYLQ
jgi:hypothetical protein